MTTPLRRRKRPILAPSTSWGVAASGFLAGTVAWLIMPERHPTAPPWRAFRIGLQLLVAFAMFAYAVRRLRREREEVDD